MAKSNASGLLTSLDSLFTTQEQRDAAKRDVVLDLPLDQIGDFPNHPFKVRQDDAMMEMMESVQLHGVLVPGLVRQLADGSYQMVSGHRRKLASRLAGLNTASNRAFPATCTVLTKATERTIGTRSQPNITAPLMAEL